MKSKMRKNLIGLLVVALLIAGLLSACGGEGTDAADSTELPIVGIVQIVEHPSLDTIRDSILAQLAEEGFIEGETITVDYQNAQNEQSNLKTICQKFASNNYDLIIAIATPSAQAALGETSEIPIIFSAVTDPIAAELVDDPNTPGGNITGTSDAVSAQMIMDLAREIT
ncbi:MAG: ABC transporter substrate-binding protein, partial [Eubacteriales bacterium]|nr:ABC transporter substrate-binding protein [Eubacteriales bacterium]